MPIQRHMALAPLSREHHLALQLARGLRSDASTHLRAMLPESPAGRAAHVRRLFAEELDDHFQDEEAVLIPAVTGRAPELDALCAEIVADHAELRSIAASLSDTALAPAALDVLLDRFGRLLEAHVRKEERSFYEQVQQVLAEAELGRLSEALDRHTRARGGHVHSSP